MFFHVITTTSCNLKCMYCYGKSLEDMEEEHGFDIDYSVPENVNYRIEDLLGFLKKDEDPTVTFYGGEPLCNMDFIRKVMDSFKARFMVQTNGILLDKLGSEYVNRFHTILVSLDGDEKLTDFYRGKGTYRKVLRNIDLIRGKGFSGELIARMTVEERTDIHEAVRHLLDVGFESIHWQMDAGFWEHDYAKRDFREWSKKSYNPGIKKLVDLWIEYMRKGTVLRLYPFLGITKSLLNKEKAILRCGSGYTNFAILTDGNIVPCPIMVGMKDLYCGDIRKSDPKKLRTAYEWKEPCRSCGIFGECGGRCMYINYLNPWKEHTAEICDTVMFLITSLKEKIPEIEKLVKEEKIKREDFDFVEYNGCEIIP